MPAFAYATGVDEDGEYTGLTMGQPFKLYFDDNALIVQPDIAQKHTWMHCAPRNNGTKRKRPKCQRAARRRLLRHHFPRRTRQHPPKLKTRYYGTKLDRSSSVPCVSSEPDR